MSNFPVVSPDFKLLDFGNITSEDQNLEKLKKILLKKFLKFCKKMQNHRVLGGGHEVTFAHYSGIKKHFPSKNWYHQSRCTF